MRVAAENCSNHSAGYDVAADEKPMPSVPLPYIRKAKK